MFKRVYAFCSFLVSWWITIIGELALAKKYRDDVTSMMTRNRDVSLDHFNLQDKRSLFAAAAIHATRVFCLRNGQPDTRAPAPHTYGYQISGYPNSPILC